LDIALQYKSESSNDNAFDLNGGSTCFALKVIKKVGYCPRQLSPIESGVVTQKIGGLFDNTNSLYRQSKVIETLKNFMNEKKILKESGSDCSKGIIKKTSEMIQALKENPNIKLPFPKLKNFFLSDGKIRSYYLRNYKNRVADPISEQSFLNEFELVKQKIFTKYINSFLKNESDGQRRLTFNRTIGAFYSKYGLSEKLNEPYERKMTNLLFENNKSLEFRNHLVETQKFYKRFFTQNSDVVSFSDSRCLKSLRSLNPFLSSLHSLAHLFRSVGGNVSMLYGKDGSFVKSHDLIGLAIAPRCLNTENRSKLPFDVRCDRIIKDSSISTESEISNKRLLIVRSLMSGVPIGNSHVLPGGSHINTIVGYRFNSMNNSCEYKIRESQTGTPFWVAEKEVIDRNKALIFTNKM
jgi:hypothetical protein